MRALLFLLLGLAVVGRSNSETTKNKDFTSSYGLALVENNKSETEKNNTPTKSNGHTISISKNKNETKVVFLETTAQFGNKNSNNNIKFGNNDTNYEFRENSNFRNVKKRSIEPDEGDPRIVSLDYELINKVWPQEFIDEYKKKNKQGMSGCKSPVLSVLCYYLTCLFLAII